MSSVYYIDGNDTNAVSDSGLYNCEVILTINNTDQFMNVSDGSLVVLRGKVIFITILRICDMC